MKRRTLILSGLGAAGALLVGWGALPQRSRLGEAQLMPALAGEVGLNGWIKIAADGAVIVAMPRSEMGQGVHSAFVQLVAEEMGVSMSQVRLEQAGLDKIYGNVAMFVAGLPFHPREDGTTLVNGSEHLAGKVARELGVVVTGGSSSMADAWGSVRVAAATAREQLLHAAAAKLGVTAQSVQFEGSQARSGAKSIQLAELAKAASGVQVSGIVLKAAKDFTLIGKAQPRIDVLAKVNGQAQFGLDVRLPGMVYAAIKLSPALGGAPGKFDVSKSLALPGVERVVQLPADAGSSAGFAVIGISTWHARQGAAALEVEWQPRLQGTLNSADIESQLMKAAEQGGGMTFHSRGDIDAAQQSASKKLQAQYSAPYLAHATLEPMNCTAQFKDGKLELWAPTQVPGMARDAAARTAGIRPDDVTVHVTLLGGGFGRRLEVDFICQAVRVALHTGGRPVQLVYSREEDMGHDFYRPAHAVALSATIGTDGKVNSLRIQSAGDAIAPRWFDRALTTLAGPVDGPDKTTAEGLFDLPYDFAHQHMSHVATKMGVPVGFWRSVGHSHNAFFSECFIDELAHATKTDPVAFRRQHLTGAHAQRHLLVLNLAAEKAGWGKPLPAGRALGVAVHEAFNSVVAQIAEVSLEQGIPRVHRVVCAVHCGQVINPQVVEQQVQGSVVFALTAALWGRIDLQDSVVKQTNYAQYRMLKLAETPIVETYIVPSEAHPTGMGEPAVPPLAAAVANALFTLTGKRHRSLPLVSA